MKKLLVENYHVESSETIRKTPPSTPVESGSTLVESGSTLVESGSPGLHVLTEKMHQGTLLPGVPDYTQVFTQPFDFSRIIPFLPQHIKRSHYSPEFLSWFVGFTEGDGSFLFNNQRLFFVITQKDGALLHRIRTHLGFGKVYADKKIPEIHRYIVTHRSQIRLLIEIFNGNLLLKKTTQRFSTWVDGYNSLTGDTISVKSRWCSLTLRNRRDIDFSECRGRLSAQQIESLRCQSVMWNTSWLTGFLEAEAGFSVIERFKRKTDQFKTLELRFLLDQTDELQVLLHVRDVLGDMGSVWIRKTGENGERIHYRYDVGQLDALLQLVKYLKGHPLRSQKNIVYVRWKKILNYVDVIRQEKRNGTYVWSEKRHKRIQKLMMETKKSFREVFSPRDEEREVEERVQKSLKDDLIGSIV